jgi:hypothetical protein
MRKAPQHCSSRDGTLRRARHIDRQAVTLRTQDAPSLCPKGFPRWKQNSQSATGLIIHPAIDLSEPSRRSTRPGKAKRDMPSTWKVTARCACAVSIPSSPTIISRPRRRVARMGEAISGVFAHAMVPAYRSLMRATCLWRARHVDRADYVGDLSKTVMCRNLLPSPRAAAGRGEKTNAARNTARRARAFRPRRAT